MSSEKSAFTAPADDGRPAAEAPPKLVIRQAAAADAASVALIYNHYVTETTATFETEPVHPAVMADRIKQCRGSGLPWLLAEQDGSVLGYAYAMQWKPRRAYRHACETTIYMRDEQVGRGIGTRLYAALLERLETLGCHTAIGGIALPNPASVALHEALGFEKTAHFREVGFKLNRWVDVGYWQKMFGRDQSGSAVPASDADG